MIRRNAMGEAYCHNVDELRRCLLGKGVSVKDVFCPGIDADDDTGLDGFTAEIHENGSGEVVCFVEGATKEFVKGVLKDAEVHCW